MATAIKKPIQIFARLKPMPGQDPFPYDIEPIEVDETNDEILVINLKNQHAEDGYFAHRPQENHRFRYSKVFDGASPQQEVFEEIVKPVIDGALSGYNGTIFAYGQTGSGKTYTMTGSRANFEERGIIPRTLSYIFERFHDLEDRMEVQTVYISYLEIYNENGYDLLHPNMAAGKLEDLKKVMLMEDSHQQIHLKHLSVNPVDDEDEAMHLFYMGEHHRTIAETPMNEASTRSHCIFTIHVHTRETANSIVRKSKIHLVDLAGSERISNSNISGQLFNEARHINLALHYLEQVIVALGEANRTHIPYRNSMMTSILRDSLGGNCMTSMIATLSLETRNIPETLSTCRFSQRVALVTNDATLNEEVDPDMLIAQLKAEIKRLKAVVSSSSILPLTEDSAPLNLKEFQECCDAVQGFLMDPDEDSILTIPPDMRLVQQCFQCLKCACNETHAKVNNALVAAYKYDPDKSGQSQGENRVQELLTTLSSRDNEIKILSKMLKDALDNGKKEEPKQIAVPGSEKGLENDVDDQIHTQTIAKLEEVTGKFNQLPYSPPLSSRVLLDKESLMLEGFSDKKREAWENFVNTYGDKEQINSAKDALLQYRTEVSKIKEEMKRQHETLNVLRHSMMTSPSNRSYQEAELCNTYKDVYVKHEKILANKEKQLLEATDQVNKQENVLKCMLNQLIETFENEGLHKTENQLKSVAAGVFKRSDSDNDKSVPFNNPPPTFRDLPVLQKPWMHNSEDGASTNSPTKTKKSNGFTTPQEEPDSSDESTGPSQKIVTNSKSKSKPKSGKSIRTASPTTLNRSSTEEEVDATDTLANNNNCAPNKHVDNGCPLTGDPVCDKEILSFIRKRQAVFKKISETGRALSHGSQPASRSTSNENGQEFLNPQAQQQL